MKWNIFLQIYLKFKRGWSGEHTGNLFLRIFQLSTISQLNIHKMNLTYSSWNNRWLIKISF